ncbi:MAG: hypothetical protein JXJ22_15910 [Bacteroidales bacterium]|nr:hypothetical protein [Bacteroidales bacterium]
MKTIHLLTDYKNQFGSKYYDTPYRSGFDKKLLGEYFLKCGYTVQFLNFSNIDLLNNYNGSNIIYTSTEDMGYFYKSYIEDVIYGLSLSGANVMPAYKYLKANNNKVFMEQLRKQNLPFTSEHLYSYSFGTKEEFENLPHKITYPCVIKKAEGASGRGVYLANSQREAMGIIKKITRTKNLKYELWDLARSFKHKGYKRDSRYRSKCIVQEFIPDLTNDWKIYIFGDRYYIFYRPVFKHRGFRASGGGYPNYFYGKDAYKPEGLLDFAKKIFDSLDVPHLSIDIAYDGKRFYLLEFQGLYFGTAGIVRSKEFYTCDKGNWIEVKNTLNQEQVYVDSIVSYLNSK